MVMIYENFDLPAKHSILNLRPKILQGVILIFVVIQMGP